MKHLQRIFILAAAVAAVALPATAGAGDPATCQTNISDLRAATLTTTFTGKSAAKDQAGLVGKLDNASSALSAGKTADAIRKVTDYRGKVMTLASSGKIAGDGSELIDGADAAIACISVP